MNIHANIRKLARSSYWQELFKTSKECSGIHLFDNCSNFSGPQKLMMSYLKLYDMLYDELYSLKWENLSEAVLNDDDRCDAFLYWRRKQIEKDLKTDQKEDRKGKKNRGQRFKIFQGPKNKNVKDGNS